MKYISLLRGINVGGHKKIKMADLITLYESLGFTNVGTYIQSGNVIFDTSIKNAVKLKEKIEKAIEEAYHFQVPVEIRTNHDFESIITNNPFGTIDMAEDGTKISVVFLSSSPPESKASNIQKHVVDPEKLVISGKEAYIYCPNGFAKSKLPLTLLERKLGVVTTARNWKTVYKLYKLTST